MPGGKVRYAKKEDYKEVEKLFKELHKMHVKLRPSIYQNTKNVLSKEEFAEKVKRYLIIVAEYDGKIIGALEFHFDQSESTLKIKEKRIVVSRFIVAKECRGSHVGSRMLDLLKMRIESSKSGCAIIAADATNEDAIEMYAKNGFEAYQVKMILKGTEQNEEK